MHPFSRHPVNKHRSASKFRGNVGRTKAPNTSLTPMRGGWRL